MHVHVHVLVLWTVFRNVPLDGAVCNIMILYRTEAPAIAPVTTARGGGAGRLGEVESELNLSQDLLENSGSSSDGESVQSEGERGEEAEGRLGQTSSMEEEGQLILVKTQSPTINSFTNYCQSSSFDPIVSQCTKQLHCLCTRGSVVIIYDSLFTAMSACATPQLLWCIRFNSSLL